MDVASLVWECNKLGPPVDLVEVSEECFGWSPAQVLQLRLEHLLLQRRQAVTEGRLKKTEVRLKEMEGKMVRRNEEIKNLKAEIRILMGRDSEGPTVQTAEEEEEEYETIDWATTGQMTSTLGNGRESEETPSSIPGMLGEKLVIGQEEESQTDTGGGSGAMMENVNLSEREEKEETGRSRPDLGIVNATSNGDWMNHTLEPEVPPDTVNLEMEDDNSSSSSDCILILETQGGQLNECGDIDATPPKPKDPAPGIPERRSTRLKTRNLRYICDQPSSSRTNPRKSRQKVCSDDRNMAPQTLQNGKNPRSKAPERASSSSNLIISSSSTSDSISIFNAQRSPMADSGRMVPGTLQAETSTPAPGTTPRSRLSSHSEQRCIPDRPSSTLANHSDSDMEVSNGEDDCETMTTRPNSGSVTVAVVNTKKRFACLHCPKTFSHNNNLVNHRFREHRNDPGVLKCDQCRRAFLSEEDLKVHNSLRHRPASEKKTFKCEHCPKLFFCKKFRWQHQRMHDGKTGEVKRAKCELCPHKSFGTFKVLNEHKKRCHSQLN